ncbi:TRAP transporter small permease [Epibacterium ulvae]|uniref:TRAP transporter small permease subunit n=1 Tax=Epibacterium ulvae TaxID=1156985 RepID=UPI001BFC4019|nr:TRAP transporter small permease subunit [Epibacterium ulvae]MBT8155706.1 TRAP transporter small permease [Epibacterium ulvae]
MLTFMDQTLSVISRVSLAVGGLLILALALIGALDTVMSAALNVPLPAANTIAEEVLPGAVFLSMGFVIRSNGNIVVDLFTSRMGPKTKHITSALAALATLLFFCAFSIGAWKLASESLHLREVAVAAVEFPVWPLKLAFAIGASIATVETFALLLRSLSGVAVPGPALLEEDL